MNNLFENYNLKDFETKPRRKDEDRLIYEDEAHRITGWPKHSIRMRTWHWPIHWWEDALASCRHFSSPKARNFKFKEFVDGAKLQ